MHDLHALRLIARAACESMRATIAVCGVTGVMVVMNAQLHGDVRKVHVAAGLQPEGPRHARPRHRAPDLRHEATYVVSLFLTISYVARFHSSRLY